MAVDPGYSALAPNQPLACNEDVEENAKMDCHIAHRFSLCGCRLVSSPLGRYARPLPWQLFLNSPASPQRVAKTFSLPYQLIRLSVLAMLFDQPFRLLRVFMLIQVDDGDVGALFAK